MQITTKKDFFEYFLDSEYPLGIVIGGRTGFNGWTMGWNTLLSRIKNEFLESGQQENPKVNKLLKNTDPFSHKQRLLIPRATGTVQHLSFIPTTAEFTFTEVWMREQIHSSIADYTKTKSSKFY